MMLSVIDAALRKRLEKITAETDGVTAEAAGSFPSSAVESTVPLPEHKVKSTSQSCLITSFTIHIAYLILSIKTNQVTIAISVTSKIQIR